MSKDNEPVAYVNGTFGGRITIRLLNQSLVIPNGMALYATPSDAVKRIAELEAENETLKARIANGVRVVADEIVDDDETYWGCYKEVERQELLNATLIFDDK